MSASGQLYGEVQQLLEALQCFAMGRVRRQIDRNLCLQHFPATPAAAIGVGRSALRIVPAPVAAVHQFLDRPVPTRQFDQGVEPGVEMPAADARPDVAHLLLPRSPDFLHVVEHFLDGPALGADGQDLSGVQGGVRAEVRGPVSRFVFQQNDPDDAGRRAGRRQEGLAAARELDATTEERDRLPAVAVSRAIRQVRSQGCRPGARPSSFLLPFTSSGPSVTT